MTLAHILAFSLFALLSRRLLPPRWHGWLILASSLIAVFWLQPSSPIRNLGFWLPMASITLTIIVWAITRSNESLNPRLTYAGLVVVLGTVLAIGLLRYAGPLCCLTASPPPPLPRLLIGLAFVIAILAIVYRLTPRDKLWPVAASLLILAAFIVLKTDDLARATSAGLRTLNGQSTQLASSLDLPWLGFSYLAFRLLHILRDHQSGKLSPSSLDEFITYALFFPTLAAGPIDRSPRFISDLRRATCAEAARQDIRPLVSGGERLFWGIFKKFVLADSLASIALNSQNAAQIYSPLWAWVLVYAYALRIYLDFSGYTDIALGLGRWLGINLPENFDRPYWKRNLTAFWNSWHITLAQWFRAYYFNPLTRALRSSRQKLPVWMVILLGQFTTMALIGLWHGITWNFFFWGAWHGLGLFIHNRWSEWHRSRPASAEIHPRLGTLLQAGGWMLTFHYVTLGWVWFALPDPASSWGVFQKLFGI